MFTCDVFLELGTVVESGEFIDRYLVIQGNDVDIQHDDRASEAEQGSIEPHGLPHTEDGDDDRVDRADQILSSYREVFFPERACKRSSGTDADIKHGKIGSAKKAGNSNATESSTDNAGSGSDKANKKYKSVVDALNKVLNK